MAKEEKKERYQVVNVATATAPALLDTETQEQLDVMQALQQILNTLEKLKGLL